MFRVFRGGAEQGGDAVRDGMGWDRGCGAGRDGAAMRDGTGLQCGMGGAGQGGTERGGRRPDGPAPRLEAAEVRTLE